MSDVTVDVRNARKLYDGGLVRALDGATLQVASGEFVAVTGPSGCGKSTLLHLLAALDRPTSGTVAVDGRDITHLRPAKADTYRREEIGLVFQFHNLLPHLTAQQNVEIAMFGTHRPGRDRRERARSLLGDVGLRGSLERRPTELSGGERQRIAIARSLANEPRVLLADEPTGSLDSASVEMLLALLHQIQAARRLTIVLVTHDHAVAGAADRVVHMADGRVLGDASAA